MQKKVIDQTEHSSSPKGLGRIRSFIDNKKDQKERKEMVNRLLTVLQGFNISIGTDGETIRTNFDRLMQLRMIDIESVIKRIEGNGKYHEFQRLGTSANLARIKKLLEHDEFQITDMFVGTISADEIDALLAPLRKEIASTNRTLEGTKNTLRDREQQLREMEDLKEQYRGKFHTATNERDTSIQEKNELIKSVRNQLETLCRKLKVLPISVPLDWKFDEGTRTFKFSFPSAAEKAFHDKYDNLKNDIKTRDQALIDSKNRVDEKMRALQADLALASSDLIRINNFSVNDECLIGYTIDDSRLRAELRNIREKYCRAMIERVTEINEFLNKFQTLKGLQIKPTMTEDLQVTLTFEYDQFLKITQEKNKKVKKAVTELQELKEKEKEDKLKQELFEQEFAKIKQSLKNMWNVTIDIRTLPDGRQQFIFDDTGLQQYCQNLRNQYHASLNSLLNNLRSLLPAYGLDLIVKEQDDFGNTSFEVDDSQFKAKLINIKTEQNKALQRQEEDLQGHFQNILRTIQAEFTPIQQRFEKFNITLMMTLKYEPRTREFTVRFFVDNKKLEEHLRTQENRITLLKNENAGLQKDKEVLEEQLKAREAEIKERIEEITRIDEKIGQLEATILAKRSESTSQSSEEFLDTMRMITSLEESRDEFLRQKHLHEEMVNKLEAEKKDLLALIESTNKRMYATEIDLHYKDITDISVAILGNHLVFSENALKHFALMISRHAEAHSIEKTWSLIAQLIKDLYNAYQDSEHRNDTRKVDTTLTFKWLKKLCGADDFIVSPDPTSQKVSIQLKPEHIKYMPDALPIIVANTETPFRIFKTILPIFRDIVYEHNTNDALLRFIEKELFQRHSADIQKMNRTLIDMVWELFLTDTQKARQQVLEQNILQELHLSGVTIAAKDGSIVFDHNIANTDGLTLAYIKKTDDLGRIMDLFKNDPNKLIALFGRALYHRFNHNEEYNALIEHTKTAPPETIIRDAAEHFRITRHPLHGIIHDLWSGVSTFVRSSRHIEEKLGFAFHTLINLFLSYDLISGMIALRLPELFYMPTIGIFGSGIFVTLSYFMLKPWGLNNVRLKERLAKKRFERIEEKFMSMIEHYGKYQNPKALPTLFEQCTHTFQEVLQEQEGEHIERLYQLTRAFMPWYILHKPTLKTVRQEYGAGVLSSILTAIPWGVFKERLTSSDLERIYALFAIDESCSALKEQLRHDPSINIIFELIEQTNLRTLNKLVHEHDVARLRVKDATGIHRYINIKERAALELYLEIDAVQCELRKRYRIRTGGRS